MMSSMSVAGSFEITGKNDFYFWRHFWHIILGIPVFLVALNISYETLRRLSPLLFLISLVFLILVLVLGHNSGTIAKSWLSLGPLSFQPVEVAKIGVIIFLSAVFANGNNRVGALQGGLIPFVVILGVPALLIMAQPDFGSLFILSLIAASIYLVAGANLKHFFGGIFVALLSGIIVVLTNDYIAKRFAIFFNPELDPLGAGFQVKQALIAIGSGGLFGRGFQNSIQKFDYLPEVQSDTIFSAISEEMGFFRMLILIGVYAYIAYRGFFIARHAPDDFTKYLAVGLTTWIVGQSFINIAVNLALLPNTGITLPFLSYGGSSMWGSFAAMGMLLHISTSIKKPKKNRYFL